MNSQKRQYECTQDNEYLTNQQRDFYEENGYLIIRNLVDPELIEECKQRFIDICNKKVYPKGVSAMKDSHLKKLNKQGESVISRIQNVHFDDVLRKYVIYKPILDVVQSIIGPNISCCHSILINKPPHSEKDSSRHPLHQDLFFFPFRPATSLVACWTAMEPVTKENGCLFVVPKSHKMDLQSHHYPPNVENRAFYGVLDENKFSPIYLNMNKGDTVFFHTLLLHGSGPNVTTGFRKALTCHYVNNNSTFVNMKNKLEVYGDIAEKWGYGKVGFETFWKKKCWIVRGSPGKIQNIDSKL